MARSAGVESAGAAAVAGASAGGRRLAGASRALATGADRKFNARSSAHM